MRLDAILETVRKLAVPVGVVIVILLLALALRSGCEPAKVKVVVGEMPGEAAAPDGNGEEAEQTWTCSMHPTIKQPGPGICPICNMDLVPLADTGGGGMRRFVTGEAALELMEVETSPVERRPVTREIRMVGKVDYDETRMTDITAWLAGRLDRLFVDFTGIRVAEGDHMVEVYSPELLAAQEELLQARDAVEGVAESDITEIRRSARDTLEAARDKLRLLGLKPEQISAIEERGSTTDHVTIYAPVGGVVVQKHAQEGAYVQTGAPLYTIADLSHLWVQMDAYESDLPWLAYGQPVEIRSEAYPGEVFRGRVSFISPVLNEQTRTVKVRANVENQEDKLKPGMFVRAAVRATVSSGGRVMDPSLAGKWICPMHPAVTADGPADCTICGMPLVTPESLGYSTVEEEGPAPLVIPASAALVTGTRAVVYLKLPDAEKPTFEGREVVLGPRAGDYYIVRHGLQEGDIVVTKGNFKIDSALQIAAKPSMMAPMGGTVPETHDHGQMAEESADGRQPEAATSEAPSQFRQWARGLMKTGAEAMDSAAAGELEPAREAFRELADRLETAPLTALPEARRPVWTDLAMLLGNDAFEGRNAETLEGARRVADDLSEHLQRVGEVFGVEMPERPEVVSVPADLDEDFTEFLDAYLALWEALSADDEAKADEVAERLLPAWKAIDASGLAEGARRQWQERAVEFAELVRAVQDADGIAGMRTALAPLSLSLASLVRDFGLSGERTLYYMFCPMAFDDAGAYWLQADRDLLNPYFGAEMLYCGLIAEELGGGEARTGGEHVHE